MPFKTDPDWLQTTEIVRGSNQTPAQSDGESNRLPSQLLDNTLDNRSRISALETGVTTLQGDYATRSQLDVLLASISSLNRALPSASSSKKLVGIEFSPAYPNNNIVELTSISNGLGINLGRPSAPAGSYPNFWKIGANDIPDDYAGIFGKFVVEATKGAGAVDIVFYVGETAAPTGYKNLMGSLSNSTSSSGDIVESTSFFYPRPLTTDLYIYFEVNGLPTSYTVTFNLTGYLG